MSTRVIHIISGLNTGGAETMLYKLLANGLHRPEEALVISLGGMGSLGITIRRLGVRVECLRLRSLVDLPVAIMRLRRLNVSFRPDVVQGWMYHGNLAALVAGFLGKRPTPVVWNIRHSLYDIARERRGVRQVIRLGRGLSSRADSILYNSETARLQHEAFGFRRDKSRVIPNGFCLRSDRQNRRSSIRSRLGIADTALVVGHVARFHPMKNHLGFMGAMAALLDTHPDLHLLMAGSGIDPSNQALMEVATGMPQGRVHLLGERKDAAELMAAMDVFCVSSSWGEAFPNVLGEAMAAGVPCVTTDVGDSAEIVGDTGVVTPPLNSEALREGVLSLLMLRLEEREILGRAAQERVERRYRLPRVVDQYAELYSDLLEKPK